MNDLRQLRDDLARLRNLLRAAHGSHSYWDTSLADVENRLVSPGTRDNALIDLRSHDYFGGMGSLNDLVFCEDNHNIPAGYSAEQANAELKGLLDRIFREASLYGASSTERDRWLQDEARSELPPRILQVFRKRR